MFVKKILNKKIRIVRKTFIWSLLLAFVMAVAVNGDEQKSMALNLTENKDVSDVEVGSDEVVMSEDGRLPFIAFEKDSNIKAALRVLAALYNKNIVPSSKVDGLLGFTKLRNVTFEEAMNAILGADFQYEQQGNLIKVYTKEEYKKIKEDPERMIYKVFTLYYITADEAATLIKPVLSDSAKIEKSTPAEKQISGGSEGSSTGGGSLSSGGGGDSMALHDTIVIYDFPERIAKAEEVLKNIDIKPMQVLVEATILSATLTEEMDIGVDLNLLTGVSVTGFPALYPGNGTHIETAGFALTGRGLKIGVSSNNVQAFIRALESVTDVTILANPKILAVNKQQGSVLIGQKLGYRGTSYLSAQGTEVTGDVKFLETGTRLVFRPYIANDGYIRMDIYPKDSTGALNDEKVPNETTTELQTNILVKDGETIVIGGLFRDKVSTIKTQVPLIGNLPILGAAFRGTTDTVERQEVIVLLTPHIIEEPKEAEGQARADDIRRKRFAAKQGTQGIGRARLAEDCYADAARYYIEGDNESAMRKLRIALTLRPTYLEAIRLKEKILAETDPEKAEMLERIILEDIDRQEAPNWLRW